MIALLLLLFVLFTTYGVLVMLSGVMVWAVLDTGLERQGTESQEQAAANKRLTEKLRGQFEQIDLDGNGILEQEEVEDVMANPEICRTLDEMDLPVENAQDLFNLLDLDRSGAISFDEFVGGCLRLRTPLTPLESMGAVVAVGADVERLGKIEARAIAIRGGLEELVQGLGDAFAQLRSRTDQLCRDLPEVGLRREGRIWRSDEPVSPK